MLAVESVSAGVSWAIWIIVILAVMAVVIWTTSGRTRRR